MDKIERRGCAMTRIVVYRQVNEVFIRSLVILEEKHNQIVFTWNNYNKRASIKKWRKTLQVEECYIDGFQTRDVRILQKYNFNVFKMIGLNGMGFELGFIYSHPDDFTLTEDMRRHIWWLLTDDVKDDNLEMK